MCLYDYYEKVVNLERCYLTLWILHCRIFQLLGIGSWFKFKYQSWKIKYISHQKLISRCFAKMLQYKEGKEIRAHLIGILIWKYFGLCTLQVMKLHSWKQFQFFAWERYRKAIKKLSIPVNSHNPMEQNIQQNLCILLNLCIGANFFQGTVFCYSFR